MNKKILVTVLIYNEGEKLKDLVQKFPENNNYTLLFIDDGSNDGTYDYLKSQNFNIIRHEKNYGVGIGIKEAIGYGRENNFDVIVIMAGNGKMLPSEIDRLTQPITDDEADYIQGSRYLEGGNSPHLPVFRHLAIKLFTMIANFILGFKGTDITCGFRAYRLDLFDDTTINITQDWLGKYEMEYYIHYKVIKNGYRVKEVPVSMIYPKTGKNYTKIKPFIGWWSMLRPWIYLTLRIKK